MASLGIQPFFEDAADAAYVPTAFVCRSRLNDRATQKWHTTPINVSALVDGTRNPFELDRRTGAACTCAGACTQSPTKQEATRAGAGQGWGWGAAPGGRDGTRVRLVGCELLTEEIAHGLLGREARLVNVE